MAELQPPDTHHYLAASGWLDLGNPAEAKLELDRISPELRHSPDVLELEWAIDVGAKDWTSAMRVARKLVDAAPDRASGWLHLAYATRRVAGGGLKSAWDILLPAANQFPEDAVIPFNLACYACQMGNMEEARAWLDRAMKAGGNKQILNMALNDRDLEPLWPELQKQSRK